jgi:hypothetical protein
LPGTLGWGAAIGWYPTALWVQPKPIILNNHPTFGMQTNGFNFLISWATNLPVVIEVCTNLSQGIWLAVQTNTLANGTSLFSDPGWTNCPARLYRVRSP